MSDFIDPDKAPESLEKVIVPNLCREHRKKVLDALRLKLKHKRDEASIQAADATLRFMLMGRVSHFKSVKEIRATGKPMTLILNDIGCLACFDRKGWQRAIDLMVAKGITHCSHVVNEFVKDDFWKWEED